MPFQDLSDGSIVVVGNPIKPLIFFPPVTVSVLEIPYEQVEKLLKNSRAPPDKEPALPAAVGICPSTTTVCRPKLVNGSSVPDETQTKRALSAIESDSDFEDDIRPIVPPPKPVAAAINKPVKRVPQSNAPRKRVRFADSDSDGSVSNEIASSLSSETSARSSGVINSRGKRVRSESVSSEACVNNGVEALSKKDAGTTPVNKPKKVTVAEPKKKKKKQGFLEGIDGSGRPAERKKAVVRAKPSSSVKKPEVPKSGAPKCPVQTSNVPGGKAVKNGPVPVVPSQSSTSPEIPKSVAPKRPVQTDNAPDGNAVKNGPVAVAPSQSSASLEIPKSVARKRPVQTSNAPDGKSVKNGPVAVVPSQSSTSETMPKIVTRILPKKHVRPRDIVDRGVVSNGVPTTFAKEKQGKMVLPEVYKLKNTGFKIPRKARSPTPPPPPPLPPPVLIQVSAPATTETVRKPRIDLSIKDDSYFGRRDQVSLRTPSPPPVMTIQENSNPPLLVEFEELPEDELFQFGLSESDSESGASRSQNNSSPGRSRGTTPPAPASSPENDNNGSPEKSPERPLPTTSHSDDDGSPADVPENPAPTPPPQSDDEEESENSPERTTVLKRVEDDDDADVLELFVDEDEFDF